MGCLPCAVHRPALALLPTGAAYAHGWAGAAGPEDPSPGVRALPLVTLLLAGVTVAALYLLPARRRRAPLTGPAAVGGPSAGEPAARVRTRAGRLPERLAAAHTAVGELTARYAASAVAPVRELPDEADDLLAVATERTGSPGSPGSWRGGTWTAARPAAPPVPMRRSWKMSGNQSILARTVTLARAGVHSLLDSAEDPERMLQQMIRDYAETIQDAEEATAAAAGQLRLSETDQQRGLSAAEGWGGQALTASNRADELRRTGRVEQADEFDRLAKVALEKQLQFERQNKITGQALDSQREVADQLREGLAAMRDKLDELQAKQSEFLARRKTARAAGTMRDTLRGFDLKDPDSELRRFEEKIRREEARAIGMAEPARTSTLDQQYQQLEDLGAEAEVAARLAALKNRAA
jgi:phage shock protein A